MSTEYLSEGVSPAYETNIEIYREACDRFGRILDDMSRGKGNAKKQRSWERRRREEIRKYDQDSIFTLLPERTDRGYAPLTRAVNLLGRLNVKTKEELLMLGPSTLKEVDGVGEKTLDLISAMQDIALCEFHIKWSR